MTITKSFNKKTGIYYVYETEYVWDESKQKKVQHRRCIGKIDPETGEVIPNEKRGGRKKQQLLAGAHLEECYGDSGEGQESTEKGTATEIKEVVSFAEYYSRQDSYYKGLYEASLEREKNK